VRVGVLTFHRCINYGSYWQARALVEGLRARGLDAVLLDHDSRRVNVAEWRCAFRPLLPAAVPRDDRPLYRDKIRSFLHAFSSLPLSRRFPLDDTAELEHFDTVVVGSDEVWNLSHPWYGGCGLFFGDGIRATRLVSYAASFGNHATLDGLLPWWADRLRRFDAISVRDENSQGIVEAMLGEAPELVLDPCLQFDLPIEPVEVEETEPFVVVYGHSFTDAFGRHVRRWAHGRGYRLVSVGYRNDWADDQRIAAGPHEFAHLLAQAEAVATNFFHGCVFALRHAKPFTCELSPYRSTKVRDLLAAVGAGRRLVSADTAPGGYAECLSTPVEPEVRGRIGALRRSADGYLHAALA
jgi:Polysaccharide pyruvyl transferase